MKRWIFYGALLIFGLAVGAAGGYGVGTHVGEDRAFDKTAQYLHKGGTPPWAGQGDEGLALCITLTEGENAGDRCLTEVQDEKPASEETFESDSGSPTTPPTVDLQVTILSPTVASTPTTASSATPSPTPTATARPTRDGTGD